MQLINLSPQALPERTKNQRTGITFPIKGDKVEENQSSIPTIDSFTDLVNENKELLLKSNPGKLLYSIKETAKILGISYENVRQNIHAGTVQTKNFGGRMMVHLNELSKLLSKGITTT